MRMVRGSGVLLCLCTLLAPLAAGAANDAVRSMEIAHPDRYWTRGYVPMVPSIRLPTSHSGDDRIQVWLRLPAGGRVDVRYLPSQDRYSLVFPPGTRSDRVEYLRVADAHGERWTVVDVRGTTIEHDGGQRYHVLRPLSDRLHAPLRGWSWPKGDAAAQAYVDRQLARLVQEVRRPPAKPPMDGAEAREMVRFNQCAQCHRPDRARARFEFDHSLERGTDSMGFFVPQAVVQDHCVVANHRPRDLNAEDPYVTVTCGDQPARLRTDHGRERYTCPDDQVPMGTRDVGAALQAGQPYTRRVCASRRYLYRHMTDRARDAYAPAFRACGLVAAESGDGG